MEAPDLLTGRDGGAGRGGSPRREGRRDKLDARVRREDVFIAQRMVKGPESTDEALAKQRGRNEAAIRLLKKWLADESGYDERVWPIVKEVIENHRLSFSRRFRD